MKKIFLLSALITSACNSSVPMEQFIAIRQQIDTLSARINQLEQNQNQTRGRLEEVASSRLVPKGVSGATVISRKSDTPYQIGLNAYRSGNIDEAIHSFTSFLETNPSGEEALLSNYWLGDAYYTQRNYDFAARYLNFFLKNAPQHERAANALEKLIKSLRAIGKNDAANILEQYGVSAINN